MKFVFSPISLALCFALTSSTLFGQEKELSSDIKASTPITHVALIASRGGYSIVKNQLHYQTTHPMARLLVDDSIQLELELLENQIHNLNLCGKRLRDKKNEAFTSSHADSKQNGLKSLKSAISDFDQCIHDILLPNQLKNAENIQLRLQMRVLGLSHFLESSEPKLSDTEIDDIKQFLMDFREKEKQKITELKTEILGRVFQEFTKDELKLIRSFALIEPSKIPLLQLVSQFDFITNGELEFDAKTPVTCYDFLRCEGQYSMGIDGRFKLERRGLKIEDSFFASSYISALNSLPNLPIELTEAISNMQTLRVERMAELRELRNQKFADVGFKESNKWYLEQTREINKKLLDSIKSKIRPIDTLRLKRLLAGRCVTRNGIFVEILDGTLKNEIRLTSDRKERLMTRIKREYETIKEFLIREERSMFQGVGALMNEENQSHFRQLTEWRPIELYPALSLLLQNSNQNGFPLEW